MKRLRILHIGTEKSWRGGENQIRLLALNTEDRHLENHVAYPQSSEAFWHFDNMGPVCPLPSRHPLDLRSVFRLRTYCERHAIDILDAHSSSALSLALMVKSALPNIKLVLHRRTAFPIKSSYFSKRKYLNSKIDAYVGISKFICGVMQSAGIPNEKVHFVPSAVELDSYEGFHRDECHKKTVELYGLDPTRPILGMTSALTEEKGHDTLLWALAKVEAPFQLLIAGRGPRQSHLINLVNSTNLQSRVHFLGHLQDLRAFMKSLDIFLMPSRFEGLGTSVLEAMCAGVFVVASDTGGIPEMVIHRKTGLLAKVDDIENWASSLTEALKDFDLRARCIGAARSHVEQNFSLNSMIQGNLRVYQSLSPG